jgi:SAM-dependent methyltransferase
MLDASAASIGLTEMSVARHKDVVDAEIGRIGFIQSALAPFSDAVAELGEGTAEDKMGARRKGWTFEALFPYLLRDWTNTPELGAVDAVIRSALQQEFGNIAKTTIAVAGCGAGGLVAGIANDFDSVFGFDLTLSAIYAARCLLDGKSLDFAVPSCVQKSGYLSLTAKDGNGGRSHVDLLVMDAFDTAFDDNSIDAVVTSFIVDLLPDPRRMAREIHRIVRDKGVWINYGPSGPLNATWRFDQAESAAFFESEGFSVRRTDEYRASYLDLTRDCPSWSYQSHMCYLTVGRKSEKQGNDLEESYQHRANIFDAVPQLFPGALLVRTQPLLPQQKHTIVLRHERIPGRIESFEIDPDTAEIISLIDGKRTVGEIAELATNNGKIGEVSRTADAFGRYFDQGLLKLRLSSGPLAAH